MAVEYVVREPFSLPGSPRIYQVGEHIADAATMEQVDQHHLTHVRRINRAEPPAAEPAEQPTQE